MEAFKVYQSYINNGYHKKQLIQSLWSGYGQLIRLSNDAGHSIIIKYIDPPSQQNHPRGWHTNIGHERKLQSYINEIKWYSDFANLTTPACRVPNLLAYESIQHEHLLVLEDLSSAGFPRLPGSIDLSAIKVVLHWLANFHATFMQHEGEGLWPIGSYWHLSTRQEEYHVMKQSALKQNAHAIDQKLNQCQYKTFIHGDAKLANFCFSDNLNKAAAVDFQYIGKGCGIKDVVYFLGSCLSDEDCRQYEIELLSYYFDALKNALKNHQPETNFIAIKKEWSNLYSFAWADFHRFLLGWMPGHHKLTNYSQEQVDIVLERLA